VRILGIEPEGIALDQPRHHRQPAPEPGLEIVVQHLGLDDVFDEILRHLEILGPLGYHRALDEHLLRHRLARVVEPQPERHHVVVLFLLVDEGELGRDRAVEVDDELLGVEGVVVVGVVPTQRARRHVAFLVGCRDVG